MDTRYKDTINLLDGVLTNQTSAAFNIKSATRTIEGIVTGTGAVAATINVYGCNTNRVTNGVLVATMTLSGTNADVAGAALSAEWPYYYAVLSGISGTGAAVTVSVSV